MPQELQTEDWFVNGPSIQINPKQVKEEDWFEKGPPSSQVSSGPPVSDRILELLRPFVAPAMIGAGVATGGLPGLGLGLGAAAATDLVNQYTQSKPPTSVPSALMDTGKMIAINELGGAALQGVGKLLPRASQAMQSSGLEPTASQQLEPGKMASLMKWIEDSFSLGKKTAAWEHSAALGQKKAGELAGRITGRPLAEATDPYWLAANMQTEAQNLAAVYEKLPQGVLFSSDGLRKLVNTTNSPIKPIERILGDEEMLQRAMNAGNLKLPGLGVLQSTNIRRDLQGYQLNQFMRMSPKEVVDTLNNPFNKERFTRLFSQRNRADIEQLFKNIERTQEKIGGNPGLAKWTLFHGGIATSASLLTDQLSLGAYSGTATGVTLGGVALARIMTNPRLARWMVNSANNMVTGISDKAASRVLVGALQGSGAAIILVDKDGNETQGTIESNDNGDAVFQPSRQFKPPGSLMLH